MSKDREKRGISRDKLGYQLGNFTDEYGAIHRYEPPLEKEYLSHMYNGPDWGREEVRSGLTHSNDPNHCYHCCGDDTSFSATGDDADYQYETSEWSSIGLGCSTYARSDWDCLGWTDGHNFKCETTCTRYRNGVSTGQTTTKIITNSLSCTVNGDCKGVATRACDCFEQCGGSWSCWSNGNTNCTGTKSACGDPDATNYDSSYTFNDCSSCTYKQCGCTDPDTCAYYKQNISISDLEAGLVVDNCYNKYDEAGCSDGNCTTQQEHPCCNYSDTSCWGCMDEEACNYNPDALLPGNTTCELDWCVGCTDITADNYSPGAYWEPDCCYNNTCDEEISPLCCSYSSIKMEGNRFKLNWVWRNKKRLRGFRVNDGQVYIWYTSLIPLDNTEKFPDLNESFWLKWAKSNDVCWSDELIDPHTGESGTWVCYENGMGYDCPTIETGGYCECDGGGTDLCYENLTIYECDGSGYSYTTKTDCESAGNICNDGSSPYWIPKNPVTPGTHNSWRVYDYPAPEGNFGKNTCCEELNEVEGCELITDCESYNPGHKCVLETEIFLCEPDLAGTRYAYHKGSDTPEEWWCSDGYLYGVDPIEGLDSAALIWQFDQLDPFDSSIGFSPIEILDSEEDTNQTREHYSTSVLMDNGGFFRKFNSNSPRSADSQWGMYIINTKKGMFRKPTSTVTDENGNPLFPTFWQGIYEVDTTPQLLSDIDDDYLIAGCYDENACNYNPNTLINVPSTCWYNSEYCVCVDGRGALPDNEGTCCTPERMKCDNICDSSAVLDNWNVCCPSGYLDACGVCDGEDPNYCPKGVIGLQWLYRSDYGDFISTCGQVDAYPDSRWNPQTKDTNTCDGPILGNYWDGFGNDNDGGTFNVTHYTHCGGNDVIHPDCNDDPDNPANYTVGSCAKLEPRAQIHLSNPNFESEEIKIVLSNSRCWDQGSSGGGVEHTRCHIAAYYRDDMPGDNPVWEFWGPDESTCYDMAQMGAQNSHDFWYDEGDPESQQNSIIVITGGVIVDWPEQCSYCKRGDMLVWAIKAHNGETIHTSTHQFDNCDDDEHAIGYKIQTNGPNHQYFTVIGRADGNMSMLTMNGNFPQPHGISPWELLCKKSHATSRDSSYQDMIYEDGDDSLTMVGYKGANGIIARIPDPATCDRDWYVTYSETYNVKFNGVAKEETAEGTHRLYIVGRVGIGGGKHIGYLTTIERTGDFPGYQLTKHFLHAYDDTSGNTILNGIQNISTCRNSPSKFIVYGGTDSCTPGGTCNSPGLQPYIAAIDNDPSGNWGPVIWERTIGTGTGIGQTYNHGMFYNHTRCKFPNSYAGLGVEHCQPICESITYGHGASFGFIKSEYLGFYQYGEIENAGHGISFKPNITNGKYGAVTWKDHRGAGLADKTYNVPGYYGTGYPIKGPITPVDCCNIMLWGTMHPENFSQYDSLAESLYTNEGVTNSHYGPMSLDGINYWPDEAPWYDGTSTNLTITGLPQDANIANYRCGNSSAETYGSIFKSEYGGIFHFKCYGNPGMDAIGCTNPDALNYDPEAIVDDGSCILFEMPTQPDIDPYTDDDILRRLIYGLQCDSCVTPGYEEVDSYDKTNAIPLSEEDENDGKGQPLFDSQETYTSDGSEVYNPSSQNGNNTVLITAPHAQAHYRPTAWNDVNGFNNHGYPAYGLKYCNGENDSDCARTSDYCTGALAKAVGAISNAVVLTTKYKQEDPNYYHHLGIDRWCCGTQETGNSQQYGNALMNYDSGNEADPNGDGLPECGGIQTPGFCQYWNSENFEYSWGDSPLCVSDGNGSIDYSMSETQGPACVDGAIHPFKSKLSEYLDNHPEIKIVIDLHGTSTSSCHWDVDIGVLQDSNSLMGYHGTNSLEMAIQYMGPNQCWPYGGCFTDEEQWDAIGEDPLTIIYNTFIDYNIGTCTPAGCDASLNNCYDYGYCPSGVQGHGPINFNDLSGGGQDSVAHWVNRHHGENVDVVQMEVAGIYRCLSSSNPDLVTKFARSLEAIVARLNNYYNNGITDTGGDNLHKDKLQNLNISPYWEYSTGIPWNESRQSDPSHHLIIPSQPKERKISQASKFCKENSELKVCKDALNRLKDSGRDEEYFGYMKFSYCDNTDDVGDNYDNPLKGYTINNSKYQFKYNYCKTGAVEKIYEGVYPVDSYGNIIGEASGIVKQLTSGGSLRKGVFYTGCPQDKPWGTCFAINNSQDCNTCPDCVWSATAGAIDEDTLIAEGGCVKSQDPVDDSDYGETNCIQAQCEDLRDGFNYCVGDNGANLGADGSISSDGEAWKDLCASKNYDMVFVYNTGTVLKANEVDKYNTIEQVDWSPTGFGTYQPEGGTSDEQFKFNREFAHRYKTDELHPNSASQAYKWSCFDYYGGVYDEGGEAESPCCSGPWSIRDSFIQPAGIQLHNKYENLLIPHLINIDVQYEQDIPECKTGGEPGFRSYLQLMGPRSGEWFGLNENLNYPANQKYYNDTFWETWFGTTFPSLPSYTNEGTDSCQMIEPDYIVVDNESDGSGWSGGAWDVNDPWGIDHFCSSDVGDMTENNSARYYLFKHVTHNPSGDDYLDWWGYSWTYYNMMIGCDRDPDSTACRNEMHYKRYEPGGGTGAGEPDGQNYIIKPDKFNIDFFCNQFGFDGGRVTNWIQTSSGCSTYLRRFDFGKYGAPQGQTEDCPSGDFVRPHEIACYNYNEWSPAQSHMYGLTPHTTQQTHCQTPYTETDFKEWFVMYYKWYHDSSGGDYNFTGDVTWAEAFDNWRDPSSRPAGHPDFFEDVPFYVSVFDPEHVPPGGVFNVVRECGPEIIVLPTGEMSGGQTLMDMWNSEIYPPFATQDSGNMKTTIRIDHNKSCGHCPGSKVCMVDLYLGSKCVDWAGAADFGDDSWETNQFIPKPPSPNSAQSAYQKSSYYNTLSYDVSPNEESFSLYKRSNSCSWPCDGSIDYNCDIDGQVCSSGTCDECGVCDGDGISECIFDDSEFDSVADVAKYINCLNQCGWFQDPDGGENVVLAAPLQWLYYKNSLTNWWGSSDPPDQTSET